MIRRLVLLSFLLPCAALAQTAAPATTPCGGATLAPMPTSVPVPEMARVQAPVSSCINLLSYTERVRRPAAGTVDAAGYVPKTEHDNTPWRFNMEQNGRRMTADEFDAWMKAKGIRVARGRAVPAAGAAVPAGSTSQALPATAPAAATPAATSGQCVASATVSC
jgi:hypothetical protein